MRQASLLNFVVLLFFLFLFASLYRKRPTEQLRFWMVGWAAAVAHFAALLAHPSTARLNSFTGACSAAALLVCGICFLASFVHVAGLPQRALLAAAFALPATALAAALAFDVHAVAVLLTLNLLLQGLGLVLLWRWSVNRWSVAVPGTAALLLCSQWSLLASVAHRGRVALSVLLAELFASCALLFFHSRPRRSAGFWTVLAGFFAWSAIFPLDLLIGSRWPFLSINPEIWNVPKLAVAFGMLLLLLEEELNLADREREQYRSLFYGNPLPMWIIDAESARLLEVNSAAERTFGWKQDDLHHLTLEHLLAGEQASPVGLTEMHWSLAAGSQENPGFAPVRARSLRFETKTGDEIAVDATLQRVRFHGSDARLLVARDMTEELEVRRQLIDQANHDPLTGLPNRLLLKDRMEIALAKVSRHGTKTAILCVDLDRFKQINDTYGHAAGDSCLREVADRFRHRLRSVDTVARTGGEEFVIILDEIGSRGDAERVADDLLFSLSAPHYLGEHRIQLSASIGVALAPEHGADPSELWKEADSAMYRAKRSGGNRQHTYSRAS